MTTLKHTGANDAVSPTQLKAGEISNFFGFHLYHLQIALSQFSDATVRNIGIERSSLRLLLLVDGNPGAAQGQVAQLMNLKRSSIVPIVDRLESDGLLERHLRAADSRTKTLKLTKKGARRVARIKELVRKAEEEIFSGFTPEEKKLLIELMSRASENLLTMLKKI